MLEQDGDGHGADTAGNGSNRACATLGSIEVDVAGLQPASLPCSASMIRGTEGAHQARSSPLAPEPDSYPGVPRRRAPKPGGHRRRALPACRSRPGCSPAPSRGPLQLGPGVQPAGDLVEESEPQDDLNVGVAVGVSASAAAYRVPAAWSWQHDLRAPGFCVSSGVSSGGRYWGLAGSGGSWRGSAGVSRAKLWLLFVILAAWKAIGGFSCSIRSSPRKQRRSARWRNRDGSARSMTGSRLSSMS